MTVMGDAAMERFSDRGSIPLSSIKQSKKGRSTENRFSYCGLLISCFYSALGSNP